MSAKLRFAPSPTGLLHIGGARTALFNWLLAKKLGGEMLLRIDDTDTERSSKKYIDSISDGLEWLGITFKGDPVFQSERSDKYADIVMALIERGWAYYCNATSADLRDRNGRSPNRDLSLSEQLNIQANIGTQMPVRFRVPSKIEISFPDLIKGNISIMSDNIPDFVIQRGDGSALYLLASTFDDYDMGITHVVRGEDHLYNTAKQILINKAFGWDVPIYAHMPLILGSDGQKLSKRHGAMSIDEYKAKGFIPEAVINCLSLIGYSQKENKDIFTVEDLIETFEVHRVRKSPAKFDTKKFEYFNVQHLRRIPRAKFLRYAAPFIPLHWATKGEKYLINVLMLLREKVRTLSELEQEGNYFFEFPMDLSLFAHTKTTLSRTLLWSIGRDLDQNIHVDNWNVVSITKELDDILEAFDCKKHELYAPLRVALTGKESAPEVPRIMEILGKEETLARLKYVFGD